MTSNLSIQNFSKQVKLLITFFLFVLSIGFFTGLSFVNKTSKMSPQGIQENYLGNENNEKATIMKFKKSKREILTIVHTHIISMAVVFFLLGLLLLTTNLNNSFKNFLIIEPFISIIATFGGIYFVWKGFVFIKYIVLISGVLMTLTYSVSVGILLKQLHFRK